MGYRNIHGFTIQACLDTLFYVCTKTICFNCVNLNLYNEFTETLALTIELDISDMMLKWVDKDGSHNLANGYGWIWILSIFLHGYGWIWIYLILCRWIWLDMGFTNLTHVNLYRKHHI